MSVLIYLVLTAAVFAALGLTLSGIVSIANIVGLALSVLIAFLLGAALMFPERF